VANPQVTPRIASVDSVLFLNHVSTPLLSRTICWSEVFPSTTFASRGALCKTPPPLENIWYPAVIMGETGDSGHSPGRDGMAFCRGVTNDLLWN